MKYNKNMNAGGGKLGAMKKLPKGFDKDPKTPTKPPFIAKKSSSLRGGTMPLKARSPKGPTGL